MRRLTGLTDDVFLQYTAHNIQVIEDLVIARTGHPSTGAPSLEELRFSACEDREDWNRLASALAGRIKWATNFQSPREPLVARDSISPCPSWCAWETSDDQEQDTGDEGSTQDLDERSDGSASTDSEVSESEAESEDAGANLVTLEDYADASDDDGRWAWEAHLVDELSVDEEWIHPGDISYEADATAIPPPDLDDITRPYNFRATRFPLPRLAPRRY